jgi:quinol monooxygenase YgiN
MILVTGSFTAKPGKLDEALSVSLEHVKCSRLEQGCISHTVLQDVENSHRLAFVEEWTDMAALSAHFVVPASHKFSKFVMELSEDTPKMVVYEANPIKMR